MTSIPTIHSYSYWFLSCSVAPESSGGAYKGHRPPYVKLEEEQYKFKHTEEQYKYKQVQEEEYKPGEDSYKQPLRALPAQPNQYHLPPLTAAPQVEQQKRCMD